MGQTSLRSLHRKFATELEEAAGHGPLTMRIHGSLEKIKTYRLPAATMRGVFVRHSEEVESLTLTARLALAELLLRSHVEEQGHMAVGVLRLSVTELEPVHFSKLDELLADITTWWMVDEFATGPGSITANLLERFPDATIRLHEHWNVSANQWKRRTSVVTFTRKTAADGQYVDETLRFCETLMRDPEDLVQKGVGWALKDTMRAEPAAKRRVIALVKRMRREGIPSTITLYAIRDLKGAEREVIMKIKPPNK